MKKLLTLILLLLALNGRSQCILVRQIPTMSHYTMDMLTNCNSGAYIGYVFSDTNALLQLVSKLGITNGTITFNIDPSLFISRTNGTGYSNTLTSVTNLVNMTFIPASGGTLNVSASGYTWNAAPAFTYRTGNPIIFSGTSMTLDGTNYATINVSGVPYLVASNNAIYFNTNIAGAYDGSIARNFSIGGTDTVQVVSASNLNFGAQFKTGTNNAGELVTTNPVSGASYSLANDNSIYFGGTRIGGTNGRGTELRGTNRFGGPIYLTRGDNLSISSGGNAGVVLGETNAVTFLAGMAGNFTVYGINGGVHGRWATIINTNPFSMTIANNSGSDSTAANRILTGTGADILLTNQPTIANFFWSSANQRWLFAGASTLASPLAAQFTPVNLTLTNLYVYYPDGHIALKLEGTNGFKVYSTNGVNLLDVTPTTVNVWDGNGNIGMTVTPSGVGLTGTNTTQLNVNSGAIVLKRDGTAVCGSNITANAFSGIHLYTPLPVAGLVPTNTVFQWSSNLQSVWWSVYGADGTKTNLSHQP